METSFVEVRLEDVRIGIPLRNVDRILPAAAVTPVPGAGACLLGMLDLHGTPVPVYDTRRLLGLPARPLAPDDRFVLTRAGAQPPRVFVADAVIGTFDCDEALPLDSFSARASGVRGIASRADGMVFLQDLAQFTLFEGAIPIKAHG
jgi:chemotaxis signal transduction protein